MKRSERLSLMALLLLLIPMSVINAQMITDAISWKTTHSNTEDGIITVNFTANLKPGWHVYGTDIPAGGPTATSIELDGSKHVELIGDLEASNKPEEVYDPNFDMTLRWHSNSVTFTQKAQVTNSDSFVFSGDVIFMICDNTTCLPPDRYEFKITPTDLAVSLNAISMTTESGEDSASASVDSEGSSDVVAPVELFNGDIWKPVVAELKAYGDETLSATDKSHLITFILGVLGGFIALLTPCVWPMIPMTVSFFLKRSKSRKDAIRDALTYSVGIVVIYVTLGLLITGIFGASALNDLATSAVFNIIFFLLLVVFAISFFGAFEIVLPQSWTNKMDSKAESTGGLLSIFFMAFTLVLVSFSCTGPIIGTLLVEAGTSGSQLGPAIGMLGFALALALPFGLFAMFPNVLQNLPKSGGWLNSVKVVLGFLELALSLKFLSVADLAYGWGILDREVFVSLWIIIFILLGMYLLGKIRMPLDSPLQTVGVTRLFLSIISFAFAIYMIPGLWGAPLKSISAFAPPLYTQDFNLYDAEVHPKFHDYESGMMAARNEGKPVLVDFSGYGCVNCREMEASVWTDPKVKDIIDNKFILITVIVDDKTKLSETLVVTENGKSRKLKTIGDKWSYFQRTKFGSNAQPFYVMLDPNGLPLGPSYGHNLKVQDYLDWLNGGLNQFDKNK
ncbi:cytochrome c biogenesis protein CcdA [Porphyromonadaceae bacterium W3.11]|nr:cytochrome c biogenesis protein CcdA [Porphyromonadaceae bacterium W3.11]